MMAPRFMARAPLRAARNAEMSGLLRLRLIHAVALSEQRDGPGLSRLLQAALTIRAKMDVAVRPASQRRYAVSAGCISLFYDFLPPSFQSSSRISGLMGRHANVV